MLDPLLTFIVGESNWLPLATSLALVATASLLYRYRRPELPARRRILAAMNLYFGVALAIMAVGHFAAVTTHLALGNLRGSVLWLYVIGTILIVPSTWLIRHTWLQLARGGDHGRTSLVLNAWLAITLAALGLVNLPLAVPAVLNIGYQLHARRAVGWAILSFAILFQILLLVGALVFMASGQTFEQFRETW
jgi:hypothetical protein